jgi:hypothetical protein
MPQRKTVLRLMVRRDRELPPTVGGDGFLALQPAISVGVGKIVTEF